MTEGRYGVGGRHNQIIDAAAKLFEEKGYEGTSIQDIANEVGILKGSMYYYIDTKEDLLFSIMQQSHSGALALIEEISKLEVDALTRIYALVKKHVTLFAQDHTITSVFFREFRALSEERSEVIKGAGYAYVLFLNSLILEAQKEGLSSKDLDSKKATMAAVGMLNAMSFWYKPEGSWTSEEIGNEYAELAVMAIVDDDHLMEVGGRSSLFKQITEELRVINFLE
tara:strand:+ start:231 stop:905 length:675 start_codon:yes stop_codon:yes gene_type:complete